MSLVYICISINTYFIHLNVPRLLGARFLFFLLLLLFFMFCLQHVLLIALDVVKGPYMHCCAPAGPFHSQPQECCCHTGGQEMQNPRSSCGSDDDNDNISNKSGTPTNISTREYGCGASAAVNRLSGFSDVFVPRSEFCRRVMYFLEAESGLLHLFYPEEIAGLHYQRKTLRYTLCFVFRVDKGLITTNKTLTERLVRPYSAMLMSIMEELREAELRYGYISRGLARVPTPVCRGMPEAEHQQRQFNDGETVGGTDAADNNSFVSPMARDDIYTTSCKGVARINAFLTPLHDPATLQWTPLEEMIEMLYACLSSEDEENPEGNNREESMLLDKEQQQRRKKSSVKGRIASVRLSQTLSFHVGCMVQPHVPPYHALNEVPIPIADCTAGMLEWADLAVRDVFRAVDGHRTIASIVQVLATGYEPLEEDTQRGYRMLSLLSSPSTVVFSGTQPALPLFNKGVQEGALMSPTYRSANGVLLSPSGAFSPPLPYSVEMRLFSPLSLGQRSSVSPTAAAHQKGLIPSRMHGERQVDDVATNSQEGPLHPCLGEVEHIVLEALQHLEVHNYVRIIRPCQMHRSYSTTKELYSVISDRQHAARRIIGHRMLAIEERLCNFGEHQAEQRSRQIKGFEVVGEPMHSVVGTYTLTLPAVLLTTTALERQEEEEEQQRRQQEQHQQQRIDENTMLPPLCSTLRISSSAPSSGVMSSADDMISEAANALDDRGTNASVCTETEVETAAAAALYALGKFTGCSISNVQREMRRNPVWSAIFAKWEDVCCTSLVEIALLNGWLVEVPTAFPSVA